MQLQVWWAVWEWQIVRAVVGQQRKGRKWVCYAMGTVEYAAAAGEGDVAGKV